MWRLIYAIPSWIIFNFLIFLPLCLLGWILVPIAALCKAYKEVNDFDGAGNPRVEHHFTWPFMYVFDNWEDGIADNTYKNYNSMFKRIVYWSCLRNPVNNLRTIKYISCKIDPSKVRFKGSFGSSKDFTPENIILYDTKVPQWFFAWQGLYSNFYWQFKVFNRLWRLWIGWKIYPTDIYGVTAYRKNGAGCAMQFKKVLEY